MKATHIKFSCTVNFSVTLQEVTSLISAPDSEPYICDICHIFKGLTVVTVKEDGWRVHLQSSKITLMEQLYDLGLTTGIVSGLESESTQPHLVTSDCKNGACLSKMWTGAL